jgi:hypothetical protein
MKSKKDLMKSKKDLMKSKKDLMKSKKDLHITNLIICKSVFDFIKSEIDLSKLIK